MELLEIAPAAIGALIIAVIAFVIFNWFRNKKMPPTDEPLVGEYRILLNIGTHVIPIDGALHYFNKLINPKHLHILAKSLNITEDIESLRKILQNEKDRCYLYAIRSGITKHAVISYQHPIGTSPFFMTEEKTNKKLVIAAGSIGKENNGWKAVVMTPLDQTKYILNPKDYQTLEKFGDLLLTIREKAPLLEQIESVIKEKDIFFQKLKEVLAKNESLTVKNSELLDILTDTNLKGPEETIIEPTTKPAKFNIPTWLKYLVIIGTGAIIGYAASSYASPNPIIQAIATILTATIATLLYKLVKR